MSEDVLEERKRDIAFAEQWIADHPEHAWILPECYEDAASTIVDLAAALRAEREQRAEAERKVIEQSEYIQSHGLTEFEVARLKAHVETTTWYNGTLLTELSTLRERLAELETQCDRCGLKLAHEPTPGINYGPVVTTYYPPVVTNAPDQLAQVTFYPQEVIYTPGELSQYPSKTVGEP